MLLFNSAYFLLLKYPIHFYPDVLSFLFLRIFSSTSLFFLIHSLIYLYPSTSSFAISSISTFHLHIPLNFFFLQAPTCLLLLYPTYILFSLLQPNTYSHSLLFTSRPDSENCSNPFLTFVFPFRMYIGTYVFLILLYLLLCHEILFLAFFILLLHVHHPYKKKLLKTVITIQQC